MYPAALERTPTQTTVSPQGLREMISPEASKDDQQDDYQMRQKQQSDIWNKIWIVSNKTTIFLISTKFSWLLSSRTLLPRLLLSSHLVILVIRSITQNWLSGKNLNEFKGLNNVYTDNTFHNTKFTSSNAALSSYQEVLPWGFVLRVNG